ncbi:MAG: helix-turn-helix transcriptional regulator [Clostridia bacterium]|nr:helix-turn-helix transcriptional regulator [Clostridia bacterium]
MESLNKIFSENIIKLRTSHNLTQFELGEKVNYSDKAVSRWERGEAIPDARVLVQLSEIFGVKVDDLLKNKNVESTTVLTEKQKKDNKNAIFLISVIGVWTIALLVYIILYLFNINYWLTFVYALPVSIITALVLAAVWWGKRVNLILVSLLSWSIILSLYFSFSFLEPKIWLIFFIGIPAQLIILLSFKLKKHR